jgi:hypothetical protein
MSLSCISIFLKLQREKGIGEPFLVRAQAGSAAVTCTTPEATRCFHPVLSHTALRDTQLYLGSKIKLPTSIFTNVLSQVKGTHQNTVKLLGANFLIMSS